MDPRDLALIEAPKEVYQPVLDQLTCVSPIWRYLDYPRWYEERQKELEEAFPPRLGLRCRLGLHHGYVRDRRLVCARCGRKIIRGEN